MSATVQPESLPRRRILIGDAAARIKELPDRSVDMVLTSPPYFRLRNYQIDGQLGLEPHIDDWVDDLLAVTRELHRVLVPSGTVWLNLGDTFATHLQQGASRKSLLLGPERLALAMVADGWVLRNKLVWAKSNARPSSVRDRLTCSWEPIYLFAASSRPGQRTFFDLDDIRVPHRSQPPRTAATSGPVTRAVWRGPNGQDDRGLAAMKQTGRVGHVLGKNPGDVWQLASSNFRGAHHATFPLTLAERTIRAGCPQFRCTSCRTPWRRSIRRLGHEAVRGALRADCTCQEGREPGLVLDPFMGAGSTAVAAEQLSRDWLGVELNPDFAELAHQRIQSAQIARLPRGQP